MPDQFPFSLSTSHVALVMSEMKFPVGMEKNERHRWKKLIIRSINFYGWTKLSILRGRSLSFNWTTKRMNWSANGWGRCFFLWIHVTLIKSRTPLAVVKTRQEMWRNLQRFMSKWDLRGPSGGILLSWGGLKTDFFIIYKLLVFPHKEDLVKMEQTLRGGGAYLWWTSYSLHSTCISCGIFQPFS